MRLAQLYYFCKLADLEHYTKASQELHITQPSLSDAISSLEDELGIALFQKEGRNIKLTKYGKEFNQYVRSSLHELELGIAAAREKAGELGGVIDLGCIPTLLGDFLPMVVNEYKQRRNPTVKFNIYHGMSLDLLTGIKAGKYDVGFCSAEDNEPDLEFVPVIAQELIALVNRHHPLASSQSLYINDLAKYEITTYRESIPLGRIVRKLLQDRGITATFSYDDEISIGGVISENPLLAIVARTAFLKQFDNLVCIKLLDVPQDTRLIHMVYSKKNYIARPVQDFIEYVKEEARHLSS